MLRRFLVCFAVAACLLAVMPAIRAADYPTRPLTLVVAFTPGGASDVLSRILARKLEQILGQPIVIDNRPGAGGNVAAEAVAHSAPDGYTLFTGNNAILATNAALYKKINFDPVADFAPIGLIGSQANILVVNPALPVRSMGELIALAKANPGQLTTPSSGYGSLSHIAGMVFMQMTGTQFVHVPFKGAGLSVQELVAGQVKVSFDTTPVVMPFIKVGRLRALAIATPKRLASLPDLPTVTEAGVPGYVMSSWYGVFAPARTPSAIVRNIHAAVNRAQDTPDVKERMEQLGSDDARTATPEIFAAMVRSELARYAKVIKEAGIRIE